VLLGLVGMMKLNCGDTKQKRIKPIVGAKSQSNFFNPFIALTKWKIFYYIKKLIYSFLAHGTFSIIKSLRKVGKLV